MHRKRCKIQHEVKEMKLRRFKAAAVAMAAITTVCAGQAITASAFEYTTATQAQCETQSRMNTFVNKWKYTGSFRAGSSFYNNSSYISGVVVGPAFSSTTISRTYGYNPIYGGRALARMLAEDYFGTRNFVENYCNGKFYKPMLGDQLHLVNGNQEKTVLVTKTTGTIEVVEVVNQRIQYNVTYQNCNGTFVKNNVGWNCDYVTRPIKQGDANADGLVQCYNYYVWSNDLDTINSYSSQIPGGVREDVLKAACSLNNDWDIDYVDYSMLLNNQAVPNGWNTNGRMSGNFGYVKGIN